MSLHMVARACDGNTKGRKRGKNGKKMLEATMMENLPKCATKSYNTKQRKREAENNSIRSKPVTSPSISKSQRKQR